MVIAHVLSVRNNILNRAGDHLHQGIEEEDTDNKNDGDDGEGVYGIIPQLLITKTRVALYF